VGGGWGCRMSKYLWVNASLLIRLGLLLLHGFRPVDASHDEVEFSHDLLEMVL
jgi:hypothetical protein